MSLWEDPAAIALGQQHAPKITRAMVLTNAGYDHAENSVEYSMEDVCEHGWRNDCSGKVSEWFRLPKPGLSTVTMLTSGPVPGSVWFRPIHAEDIQPGDVVGIMGPGTAGAQGHVRLFTAWLANGVDDRRETVYGCIEQSIGNWGPDRALHDDLAGFNLGPYKAYRYVGIVDDDAPPIDESEDVLKTILPLGVYQQNGPDGGIYYAWIEDGNVHVADTVVGPALFPRLAERGFDTTVIEVEDIERVGTLIPAASE